MSADRGKLEVDVLHAKAGEDGEDVGDWLLFFQDVVHVAIERHFQKKNNNYTANMSFTMVHSYIILQYAFEKHRQSGPSGESA